MAKYSYDEKCMQLAAHFLEGTQPHDPDHYRQLAQHIQDAVEMWLNYLDPSLPPDAPTPEASR